MSKPQLKTALVTYGHTQALKDGSVTPRTFAFDFEEVPAIIQAFRRMVRGLEFDISEMAITTYVCARAHGKPFTAIPVFIMRAFHHGAILYNTKSDIRSPKDLEALLDPRPIGEILDAPGGVRAVLEAGRIPRDLFAGFLLEPFQGEGGYLVPPDDFLPGLRALCDEHGILLVLDEVQSGIGRTGRLFASEHWGVHGDIVCLAKGLANGLPLGAIVGSIVALGPKEPGTPAEWRRLREPLSTMLRLGPVR